MKDRTSLSSLPPTHPATSEQQGILSTKSFPEGLNLCHPGAHSQQDSLDLEINFYVEEKEMLQLLEDLGQLAQ